MPLALTSSVTAPTAALVVVLSVALGACAGDTDPGLQPTPPSETGPSAAPDTARTAALAKLYIGKSVEPLDRREGRCFARALEQRLDEDALIEAGLIGPGGVVTRTPVFDKDTAGVWVDAQLSCVDYVDASTRALLTQTRGDLDPEAYATCLRTTLTEGEIRAALVETLSNGFDSPEVAALAEAQSTCSS